MPFKTLAKPLVKPLAKTLGCVILGSLSMLAAAAPLTASQRGDQLIITSTENLYYQLTLRDLKTSNYKQKRKTTNSRF
jgi:hypothetical protein